MLGDGTLFIVDRLKNMIISGGEYLDPGRGALTANGELMHAEQDIAWCRAQVVDQHGRCVARAQGSFRYLPLPLPVPAPHPPTGEPS